MSNILTNNINPRSGNLITIGGVNDRVSIAGTLSYNDVSNIDSVGIITAQSGINVGPTSGIGITLTSAGTIIAAGKVRSGGNANTGAAAGALLSQEGNIQVARSNAPGTVFQGYTVGNSTATTVINANGNATFAGKIDVGGTFAGGEIAVFGKDSGTSYISLANSGSSYGFIGSADQLVVGGTAGDLALRSQADLTFATLGSNERARIDSSGNFGIGTTIPEYVFDTRGSINISGSIFRRGADNATFSLTNRAAQPLTFGTNDTERMRIDSSGNVMVGTTTPESESILTVNESKSSANYVTFENRQNYGWGVGIKFRQPMVNNGAIVNSGRIYSGWQSNGESNMQFNTYSLGLGGEFTRVTIKSDGAAQFFSSANTTTVRAVNGSSSGSSHRLFYGLHSGTSVANGTPIYSIFTNGTVGTPSDIRLKKNVESTRDGYLDDIANLRVVKYHWKTQEDTEHKELGLIAQEVEQIFPGLIHTEGEGDDEVKEIKRSVIPFMLLKALQEAQTRIETLEQRLTDAGL
jgi:hypothetical protein